MLKLLTISLALLAAAHAASWGWPTPRFKDTPVSTYADAVVRKVKWEGYSCHTERSGSMLPYIDHSKGEFLLFRDFVPADIDDAVGLVADYEEERPDPKDPKKKIKVLVMHLIVSVSRDKKYVYMTGTNNRYSDGYIAVERLEHVLVERVWVKS